MSTRRPKEIAFFTICSANYLSYALTLARSLADAETDVKLHVFLADRLPAAIAVPDDHVVITGIDELALDDLDDMAFSYSVLELNTAIKPYCFDYLFDVLHYDAAIYLDPDTLVLNAFDHVRTALHDGASCVLTPHITQGLDDGGYPGEDTFLTCGVFNLGFAAFANVPEARSFLKWWGNKTRRNCIVAIDRGIFTDQSYCNLAPCFIDRFYALRNPGYNVAYWNLPQRPIGREGDRYLVGGELVRFVHFSGIDPGDPTSFSKHQNRFDRRNVGALKSLVDRYVAELMERDRYRSGRFGEIPYAFGAFRDGRPVNDGFRIAYRRYRDHLPEGRSPFDLEPAFFNEAAENHERFAGIRVSRLYAAIWEHRADLQRAYDLRTPNGQAGFLAWAIEGLPRDYGIGAPFIQPLPAVSGHMLPDHEWRRRQRDVLLDRALTSRSFMIRNLLRRQLLGKERARDYWERRLSASAAPPRPAHDLSAGLDLYGFFNSETGTGQAARGIVQALQHTTVSYTCHTLRIVGAFADEVAFDEVNGDAAHDTALICANADLLVHMEQLIAPHRLDGRRRLTHWAWELPVFPAAWASAFQKVDEVWAGSRFAARAIQSATNKVVRLVPYVVQATDMDTAQARSELDLPQGPYIFLTIFDVNSFPSRKNPIAVVRAFRAAFPDVKQQSQRLVIKYHGRSAATEFRKGLAQAIAGDPRIIEIDEVYSAEQMGRLRAACDAFVSLHRSEGFGLNIAEAMAAGKLAMATHFSGNEDFMSRENSIPIPFKMVAVGRTEYPHGAGQWWAEPDHEAVVEAMRWTVDHADEAGRLAHKGKEHIRSNFSREAIAHVISEGLAGRSILSFN
ncbi:MAG: glycosyltransferase [Bradyrhizobium sp.]